MTDVLAAEDALTWFLKIVPLNTTSPNDTSTEFAEKLFSLQLNHRRMCPSVGLSEYVIRINLFLQYSLSAALNG